MTLRFSAHAKLALLLTLAIPALAADAPAPKEPERVVTPARKEVAFSIAAGEGREYGLTRVQRDGKELPPPTNMALDRKTGAFSWTPTESQAGDYEIGFLVKAPGGESGHVTRLVTVKPNDIVPPGDNSEIAKLLRQWHKEGTAAGNTGDFYDNRDRTHSLLNTGPHPQLDKVEYTKEQLDRRLDWALQLNFLHPHVTFGNSSTASGDPNWGSNPRHGLMTPGGPQVLCAQYTHNHLYIYPEHIDHDGGHNGRGRGYGDLFPANTPFYIVSQGSSGSDQPFMRAVPYALAAFRPEVKQTLVERGLIAPTLQMILRMCGKHVHKPEDYLTGIAHPAVFEGPEVDALKWVQMAHGIQRDSVPPMVQIAAFEEDLALNGVDCFEGGLSERLFDTPSAIARIVRSTKQVHRIVVSAKASYDVNKRPLTYHWVVLRGDAERIKITPKEKDGSVVELLVPWHERRPVSPGSGLESNRVDIGVFVHNGAYYSAPGFVCFYSLDDEGRTYDADGRIVEVYYGYGDNAIGWNPDRVLACDKGYDITDWPALLAILGNDAGGFASELLRKPFKPDGLAAFQQAARELDALLAKADEPKKRLDGAEAAAKKARESTDEAKKKLDEAKKDATESAKKAVADAEATLKSRQDEQKKADELLNAARREWDEAQKGAQSVLTSDRPPLKGSVKNRLEAVLNALKNDVTLYVGNAKAVSDLANACQDAAAKKGFADARDELVKLGILKAESDGQFALTPVMAGPKPPAERLTKFERSKLEWLNIALMRHLLYPGLVNRQPSRNFVPALIASRKTWRDVYHYDDKGRRTGWTRTEGAEQKDFTADGALVTKKDALGRAIEARTVEYVAEGDRSNRTLKTKPGDTLRFYEYASDQDRVGRVAKSEKAAP